MRASPAVRLSPAPRTALACLPALLALAGAACSSAPVATQAPKPAASSADAAAPGPASPARYFVTSYFGAIFDEGNNGVAVPRPEPAILQGRRVRLDGGALLATAPSPAGLFGFRSLPAHLGGGYLIWSDSRTFHAKDFLGDLTPVADMSPMSGARPWLSSVLLRTDRGVFELDLKARSVKPWRLHPGAVDAIAIDDKRGVTIDLLGRVRATTDGGQKWTDVTAERGYVANAIRTGKKGEIEIVSLTGSPELRLLPGAAAVEPTPPGPPAYSRRYYGYGSYPYQYINQPPPPESDTVSPFSQTLANEGLAWAMSAGLLLPGDRALVGREGGLLVVSTKTGAEINDAPLLSVDMRYSGCQPVRSGATLLLACSHAEGANVLVLDGPLSAPRLEATFPGGGSGAAAGSFLSDDRGHLAYVGRCGRTPPSADDFGARVVERQPYEEEDPYGYGYGSGYGPYGGYGGYDPEYGEYPEDPPEPEKPAADDKRVCVRLEGGDWIEHRLTGDDARDLYRWVLGDDGHVTALLLKGANPEEEEQPEDGNPDSPLDLDEEEEGLRRRGGSRAPAQRSSLLAVPPPPPPAKTAAPQAPPPPTGAAKAGKPPPPPPTSGPRAGKPPATKQPVSKPDSKAKPDPKVKPASSAQPKVAPPKPAPPKEALRIVRLDPKDRALRKARWTRPRAASTESPRRSIDPNFWLESDGSIRGWVRLDDDTGSGDDEPPPAGYGGDEPSPVTDERAGRFAGARISPQGKVTLLPVPRDTQTVLFGGRYGLARAEDEDGDRKSYFETTDGGATWVEVEGPPVGDIDEPYDDSRWPACSALGCVLTTGLVRVGWGSPKPARAKKDADTSGPDTDLFPPPRLPALRCTVSGDLETFPPPPPKPKSAPIAATPPKPPKPASGGPLPPGLDEAFLQQLPPDLQEILRAQAAGGSALPGLSPTSSPDTPPPASARPKAGKPPAPPKPPPPPPADIVSLRSKPMSALGQLKDKSWVADFVAPFEPAAPGPKRVSIAANGLEKLAGNVVPVLGDRGVDLLITWDKRRALLGPTSPGIGPFEHGGRFSSAITASAAAPSGRPGNAGAGSSILALDEDRRNLVLLSSDASRPVLRFAKLFDITRGRVALARRADAPGVAFLWYSPYSGEVMAAPVDLGRAEVGPFARLAGMGTLTDGGLPACSASSKPSGPTYDFIADLSLDVTVATRGDKSLFTELKVPTSALVRASADRLCVLGVEVRGSGRPLDLTATFGPKGAAVARSRSSAEDPTKLSIDKLSCMLKEPESK